MDEIFEFQCGMCDRYVSTANIHIVYNHVKDIHQSNPSFHAKCHHSSCVNARKHDYRNFLAFKRHYYRCKMKNQTSVNSVPVAEVNGKNLKIVIVIETICDMYNITIV
jgi:hypothetical protein